MQKVLLNGLQISNHNSGVQYYANNLLNEFSKINSGINIQALLLNSFADKIPDKNQAHFLKKNYNKTGRVIFENLMLSSFLRKNKFNLYHSPNYVLPININTPTVLTIHDTIAIDFPEYCQLGTSLYFGLILKRSAKKANRIIAVSETVKKDIIRCLNVQPEKIIVVYHGINEIFKKTEEREKCEAIKKKYKLPSKYILFVGNIEPKKNLPGLIDAFHILKKERRISHNLVLVGKNGWKYKPVYNKIKSLRLENEVLFTGYVEENDLPAIYTLADLFVFPSFYEGFGIPPLEAMACETPVIVSNRGALPEITGGKCPQINPDNPLEMANVIYSILSNPDFQNKLIVDGKNWTWQFKWEKSACQTLDVYKTVLDENKVA